MRWWVLDLYQAGLYVELISWIFWMIFSITLHELGHGWAAIWQGDDTPIVQQRMTFNPMVHMGPMSLLTFALIGIAWGLMPVDPSRFRWRRRGRIVVWGAGPAINLLLAFITLTATALWERHHVGNPNLYDNVHVFLTTGGWLNLALAMFNLLPVPPLDGAGILSGMSFTFYRWYQNPQAQQIGWFILLAIFMSGIGGLFYLAAENMAQTYVDAIASLLGGARPVP